LGLDFVWPLIPIVSFTALALVTSLIPLVTSLVLRAWAVALCLLVFAVPLGATLEQRAIAVDQPEVLGPEFRMISANLALGHADLSVLANKIRDQRPDVVALQEVTPANIDELRRLGVLRRYRFQRGDPRTGSVGYITLSRTRLTEIPDSALPNGMWPLYRVVGFKLNVRNVHPLPPVKPRQSTTWRSILGSIPPPQEPDTIVAGDFNATLDHRAFRSVLGRGYRDAAFELGDGLTPTWMPHTARRLTIDHVLASSGVRFEHYSAIDLPGSDHRIVVVSMQLPRPERSAATGQAQRDRKAAVVAARQVHHFVALDLDRVGVEHVIDHQSRKPAELPRPLQTVARL
jgi:endonuclease/exonuclease/phosphatase family metal-dependent hydrolase